MKKKEIQEYIKSKQVSQENYVAPEVRTNYVPSVQNTVQAFNSVEPTIKSVEPTIKSVESTVQPTTTQETAKPKEEKKGFSFSIDNKKKTSDDAWKEYTDAKDNMKAYQQEKGINFFNRYNKKNENDKEYQRLLNETKNKYAEYYKLDQEEKNKERGGVFDAFKDGYNFGDVTKTIGNIIERNIIDPAYSIAESASIDPKSTLKTGGIGALSGLEESNKTTERALNDFFKNKKADTGIQSLNVNDFNRLVEYGTPEQKQQYLEMLNQDYADKKINNKMYNYYKNALTQEDTRSETTKKINRALNPDYQQSEIYKRYEKGELTPGEQVVFSQGQQIGNQVPVIATSTMFGPTAGKALFFTNAQQNYTEDALQRGYSKEDARKYGLIMGTVETIIEEAGFDEFGGLKNMAKDSVLKAASGEAMEEAVTPYLDYGVRTLFGENYDVDAATQDAVQGAISAAISAVIMSGTSKGLTKVDNVANKINNNQQVTSQEMKEAVNELQQNYSKGLKDKIDEYLGKYKELFQNKTNQQQPTEIPNQTQLQAPIQGVQQQNNQTLGQEQTSQITPLNQVNQELQETRQNDIANQVQAMNLEQEPQFTQKQGNYVYEKSDNSKIDNLRKDAATYLKEGEQTTNFVNTLEKLVKDKDIEIRFDTKLGNNVNGTYKNGVITINPNSNRAGEFVAIHELTHAIGTKPMIDMIQTYRKSNAEFNNAVERLLSTYKTTEINEEALGDIAGQLFGNQEYINNLSMENPSLFKKIYNEIKYLWHQFTGYKNQDQFIEDLRNKWESAYRNQKVQQKAKNSNIEMSTQTDSNGNMLSNEQVDYFKNSKVRDENGNLIPMYHGTPNGDFTVFNPGSYFSPNQNYANNYQDENASILKQNKGTTNKKTYEIYLNIENPFELNNPKARDIYINEFIKGGNSEYFDPYTSYNDYVRQFSKNDGFEWLEAEELKEWIQENHPEFDGLVVQEVPDNVDPDAINLAYIPFNSNQIKNIDNLTPTQDDDIRYSKNEELDNSSFIIEKNEDVNKLELPKSPYQTLRPNVRGGWNIDKIQKQLKNESSNRVNSKDLSKFDNLDDLMNNVYYHGSISAHDNLKAGSTLQENQRTGGYGAEYHSISLSGNKNIASNFASMGQNGTVMPVILKKNANVIEMPNIEDSIELEDILPELWNKGVDAVKIGDWDIETKGYGEQELVILNPRAIMTMPQGTTYFQNYHKPKFQNMTKEEILETLTKTKERALNDPKLKPGQAEEIESRYDKLIKYSKDNATWREYLEKEFPSQGTRTDLGEITGRKQQETPKTTTQEKTTQEQPKKPVADSVKAMNLEKENIKYSAEEKIEKSVRNQYKGLSEDKIQQIIELKEEQKEKDKMYSNFSNKQRAKQRIMINAYETNAKIRKIVQGDSLEKVKGGLTDTELAKAIEKENSNYIGKKVIVDGQNGTVIGNPYGRVKIEFEDGTIKTVDKSDVKSINESKKDEVLTLKDTNGNKVDLKPNKDGTYTRTNIPKAKPNEMYNKEDIANKVVNVGDEKLSNFYSNITEKSKFITEENREQLKENLNLKYYDAITNQDTLQNAMEKLDTDTEQQVGEFFAKDKFTPEDVATGWILVKRYQDAGNFEAMSNVIEKMRDQGTKAGQTVQMYGILQRLTPEGMEYYSQKQLDNAFNKFSENKSKKQIEKYANDFTLTAEEHQFIKDTMKNVEKLTDEDAKKVEVAKIVQMLSDKLPPEKGQRLKAWMRISMLGNPKTQVRNIMGNAIIQPVNWVGDVFSSATDKLIAKKTGVRTKGQTDFKALAGGFIKGGKEAVRDAKLGIDTRDINLNRFEENIGAKPFYEGHKSKALNKAAKVLNKTNQILGNVMSGGDRVFYQAVYENSLQNQMKLNKVETPTQEMIDIATNEALSRTWNDSNEYTKSVLQIRSALNKLNVKGYGLGDILIPFAKTPANLTKAIVDYSPLGLTRSILQDGKNLKNSLENGQYNAKLQHKFADSLGKGVAGTMLYIAAYSLAKAGITSGASDDDKDVANFMRNTLGIQPYSVKIGDKSFTYDWAQPIAAPFAITADYKRITEKENQDLTSALKSAVSSGSNILLEQSFLSSIQDVFNNYNGPTEAIMDQIKGLPARATPTFFKQVADMSDPTKRQTFEKGQSLGENIKNQVIAKLPEASKSLESQRDTLGREIEKYGGDENKLKYAFNVFLNPANTQKGKTSKAAEEIYEVYKATGDKTIMPRQVGYSENIGGTTRNLTAKERNEWQKLSGEKIEKNVSALVNNSKYNNLSDEDKAAVINGIVNYSYAKAKSDIFGTNISTMYKTAAKKEEQGIALYDYYIDRISKRR